MLTQKCIRVLRRLHEMGPTMALFLANNRIKKYWFARRWRRICNDGNFTFNPWHIIATRHKLGAFPIFFEHLASDSIWEQIWSDFAPDYRNAKVAQMPQTVIRLLGYGTYHIPSSKPPWHHDFTTTQPSPESWRSSFYTDITVPLIVRSSEEKLQPDIKVPWELSRLHHLFALGLCHRQSTNNKNILLAQQCAQAFKDQIIDWRDNNPFLRGVNWVNPMEVALRSINLIWGFHFFKQSSVLDHDFWQSFTCMLYDHARFLESNWEVSDKPSNHYLSDLVGYLYLSTFFRSIGTYAKARHSTAKAIINQLEHQILPDGTCYEGSTAYHRLDTELTKHFLLICKHTELEIPSTLQARYQHMVNFIHHCTDSAGNAVNIGDDDGGSVIMRPDHHAPTQKSIDQELDLTDTIYHHYAYFGLSIIKTKTWHLTFRHPTFHPRQPTGHFHHDSLSITLSINKLPILVDPGSYVYTAHAEWRNRFRSWAAHNTFFPTEPVTMECHHNNLFSLNRHSHPLAPPGNSGLNRIVIHGKHDHCAAQGLRANRTLTFDIDQQLTITDWFEYHESKEIGAFMWRFHFAPHLILEKQNAKTWIIKKEEISVAIFISSLEFEKFDDFFAPTYGCKVPSLGLKATTRSRGPHDVTVHKP